MAVEDGGAMIGATVQERAYTVPFFAFLGAFGLGALVHNLFDGQAVWYFARPEYWLYPLQILISVVLLWHWRRHYERSPVRQPLFTIAAGVLALLIWLAPNYFGITPQRIVGFDPEYFGFGAPYWITLSLRVARAVLIVPIIEELFWRGFLLRFVINMDFTKVPIGTFSQASFWIVTAGFCLEHNPPDWPAAIATGMLYNYVAYRTKSLGSCILAHAVTNLLLCAYILHTRQWGYW